MIETKFINNFTLYYEVKTMLIHKDPGRGARKIPSDTADLDIQAVGPELHILQLNVEGLSAATREVIQSLAEYMHTVDSIELSNAALLHRVFKQ